MSSEDLREQLDRALCEAVPDGDGFTISEVLDVVTPFVADIEKRARDAEADRDAWKASAANRALAAHYRKTEIEAHEYQAPPWHEAAGDVLRCPGIGASPEEAWKYHDAHCPVCAEPVSLPDQRGSDV